MQFLKLASALCGGFWQRSGVVFPESSWQECPVWISGRPYVSKQCWESIFAAPGWTFQRVDSLDEATIRHYVRWEAGGDWDDGFPSATWWLFTVPSLLRLMGGIVRTAIHSAKAATNAEKGRSMSTRRSSPHPTCCSSNSRTSVCCGPRPSGRARSISRASASTLFPWIIVQSQPCRREQWHSTFPPGLPLRLHRMPSGKPQQITWLPCTNSSGRGSPGSGISTRISCTPFTRFNPPTRRHGSRPMRLA